MNDKLDNELRDIEAQLANLTPSQIPDDMLNRIEQAMISWEDHLPVEEKIVPFNIERSTHSQSKLHAWGIAAAVALMVSLAAVFMTGDSQKTPVITATEGPSSAIMAQNGISNDLAPELSRNITHASNEGITYAGKNEEPFKVLRIEYTEKVITHDENGNTVITEKPCVEHVLVPVPVH